MLLLVAFSEPANNDNDSQDISSTTVTLPRAQSIPDIDRESFDPIAVDTTDLPGTSHHLALRGDGSDKEHGDMLISEKIVNDAKLPTYDPH